MREGYYSVVQAQGRRLLYIIVETSSVELRNS